MHSQRYFFTSSKSNLQFDVLVTWVEVMIFLKMRIE